MILAAAASNRRSSPDQELVDIARYVTHFTIRSKKAYEIARYCLMDSIACSMLALQFHECKKLLGPIVPGTTVPNGARVLGTGFVLDPVKAAFDTGVLVRWLDYNDTWLASEWGHPSDNLGGILAVADFVSRNNIVNGRSSLTLHEVLTAMIKAHEIQGILSLSNSFNRIGLDHVILVKIASTALITRMLGGNEEQIVNSLSHAIVDGHSLRTYRHAPNTSPRKSWAAGDATSRAVRLAMMTLQGELGLPSALSASKWGFYDVLFGGKKFKIPQAYGSYVMENILFKISYPAEFHAQTAVECALKLHDKVENRLEDIERIEIYTQEPATRIISKEGLLHNPADRDHCLQYVVAVSLIYGFLTAECYENQFAQDLRIDSLRAKMHVKEDPRFTRDYYDPDKRAIGNSIRIFFNDETFTDTISIDYPLGHSRRREEGIPLLEKKFLNALNTHFSKQQVQSIFELCSNQDQLERTPVIQFMDMLTA